MSQVSLLSVLLAAAAILHVSVLAVPIINDNRSEKGNLSYTGGDDAPY